MNHDVLKKMRDMGLTLDQAIELLEAMGTQEPSAGARRQKAYRDRVRESTQGITRDVTRDVTDEHNATLSLPPSPQTPQPPTHTRECVSTRARDEREEPAFVRFWQAYPRREGKAAARKAFTKAWRKLPPFDEEQILIGGLERAKAGWGDAQFIPHAATWLNGERWNDEPADVIQLNPRQAHERPHHDAKYEARQANHARALAGADSAARQRWEP